MEYCLFCKKEIPDGRFYCDNIDLKGKSCRAQMKKVRRDEKLNNLKVINGE